MGNAHKYSRSLIALSINVVHWVPWMKPKHQKSYECFQKTRRFRSRANLMLLRCRSRYAKYTVTIRMYSICMKHHQSADAAARPLFLWLRALLIVDDISSWQSVLAVREPHDIIVSKLHKQIITKLPNRNIAAASYSCTEHTAVPYITVHNVFRTWWLKLIESKFCSILIAPHTWITWLVYIGILYVTVAVHDQTDWHCVADAVRISTMNSIGSNVVSWWYERVCVSTERIELPSLCCTDAPRNLRRSRAQSMLCKHGYVLHWKGLVWGKKNMHETYGISIERSWP